jgi:hypothetical protein
MAFNERYTQLPTEYNLTTRTSPNGEDLIANKLTYRQVKEKVEVDDFDFK